MQRAGSDDGRHSLGSCCAEDSSARSHLLRECDPAPADPRALYSDTGQHFTSVWGGAREPQSGFPDGAGGCGRQAAVGVAVLKVFSQDGFSSVLWSRSSTRTHGHDFCFKMCLFPREYQQPVMGGHRFFRRKETIFIGRETQAHILPRKINEQSLRLVPFSIIILSKQHNH